MRAFFAHILLNHEKKYAKAIKFRYILPPKNSNTMYYEYYYCLNSINVRNFGPQSISMLLSFEEEEEKRRNKRKIILT